MKSTYMEECVNQGLTVSSAFSSLVIIQNLTLGLPSSLGAGLVSGQADAKTAW